MQSLLRKDFIQQPITNLAVTLTAKFLEALGIAEWQSDGLTKYLMTNQGFRKSLMRLRIAEEVVDEAKNSFVRKSLGSLGKGKTCRRPKMKMQNRMLNVCRDDECVRRPECSV